MRQRCPSGIVRSYSRNSGYRASLRTDVIGLVPSPGKRSGRGDEREPFSLVRSPTSMSTPMLELDGSFGEGGGQVLRTSLALSLITGKAFHLRHVRAKRSKPGLQPQHLMSVRAAATVGQAKVRGDSKGSTDLVFEPGAVKPGKYRFDIGTAGATGLVLHTLYLPLMLGKDDPSELTLTGGTHVIKSPCFHFLDVTWRAYLEQFGLRLRLRMDRPGFYPRGGGEVQVFLQPCPEVQSFRRLQRGPVRVSGFSAVAGLPDQIARRQ